MAAGVSGEGTAGESAELQVLRTSQRKQQAGETPLGFASTEPPNTAMWAGGEVAATVSASGTWGAQEGSSRALLCLAVTAALKRLYSVSRL